ncbi:MAG: hypothetical protein MUO72_04200 [Bacteroidales bacterium]|nr:hypothetical protein [Bacteroidales bacterium]
MKKLSLLSALSIIIILLILNCKKDYPLSIILYDKPLATIQHYIHGKWRLVYSKGGSCSTCKYPCDNCIVEFTPDDKFISNVLTLYATPYSITWIRDKGMHLDGDSTYLMTLGHEFGYSISYVIDKIYSDTLLFYENFDEPMSYYCIRSK